MQDGMTDLKSATGKMEGDLAFIKSSQQIQIKETERNDIRRWLRIDGIESEGRYQESLSQRHGATGSWILECSSFREWLLDRGACMWLYGIGENIPARPALGGVILIHFYSWMWENGLSVGCSFPPRTFLTGYRAIITNCLHQRTSDPTNCAVLYFFCDHRDPGKQSFHDLLISLVKQLLDDNEDSFFRN